MNSRRLIIASCNYERTFSLAFYQTLFLFSHSLVSSAIRHSKQLQWVVRKLVEQGDNEHGDNEHGSRAAGQKERLWVSARIRASAHLVAEARLWMRERRAVYVVFYSFRLDLDRATG